MARFIPTSIHSIDGYPLDTALYEPFARSKYPAAALLNSGAGISKTFYEPFASWLADEGIPVLTYDYRGIGGSRGKTIRGLPASIHDWGSKDCASALRAVRTRYPYAKISVIGHSIGSVVTGFVTEPPKIESFVLISPHTGYVGDYAVNARRKMFLLWHVLMPMLTRVAGYFPGRRFGLPEDLPYGVALEWSKRRNLQSLGFYPQSDTFAKIATRALVIRPEDDPFSTRAALQRVQSAFSSTTFADVALRVPASQIGHFGFFNPRSREGLWPLALQWLTR